MKKKENQWKEPTISGEWYVVMAMPPICFPKQCIIFIQPGINDRALKSSLYQRVFLCTHTNRRKLELSQSIKLTIPNGENRVSFGISQGFGPSLLTTLIPAYTTFLDSLTPFIFFLRPPSCSSSLKCPPKHQLQSSCWQILRNGAPRFEQKEIE